MKIMATSRSDPSKFRQGKRSRRKTNLRRILDLTIGLEAETKSLPRLGNPRPRRGDPAAAGGGGRRPDDGSIRPSSLARPVSEDSK